MNLSNNFWEMNTFFLKKKLQTFKNKCNKKYFSEILKHFNLNKYCNPTIDIDKKKLREIYHKEYIY